MFSICAPLVIIAVLEASAEPQSNSNNFQSNGFNGFNGAYGSPLPFVNTHIQTSAVENPTVTFPGYVLPTSISESCHCLKTLVRPQIRNEIISVPTVDRIVRTVTSPVVETINCGGTRLNTITQRNDILSGGRSLSEGNQGKNPVTSGRTDSGFFNEGGAGRAFINSQNTNSLSGTSATTNGVNVDLIARPTIFTFQTSGEKNLRGYSNLFSGNAGFSGGRINGF